MHIVLVHIVVKLTDIDRFKAATLDNVENSLKEPGVLRFDFLQQAEDPQRFTLYEVYKSAADQVRHRETAHYLRWRDTVGSMMAEPRQGIHYVNILPDDTNWK